MTLHAPGGDPRTAPVSRAQPLTARSVRQVTWAVRHSLASERQEPVTSGSDLADRIDEADVPDFVRAARVHRVTDLLTEQGRRLSLPAEVLGDLRDSAKRSAMAALLSARQTAQVHRILAEAGVPALGLKGIALSVLTTGTLTARGPGDIDVLVRPEDLPAAHRALTESGWTSSGLAEPADDRLSAWIRWMRRERSYVSDVSTIDLHWRVAVDQTLLPPARELLTRAVVVDIDGFPVRTLAPSDALAAACYHAYLDRFARLRGLIDIVRLARDPRVAVPASAPASQRRMVAESVTFTHQLIGGFDDERLLQLTGGRRVKVADQERLWEQAARRPIWFDESIPLDEAGAALRHQFRYDRLSSTAVRLAVNAVLPPERLRRGQGPGDVVRTVAAEATDFVRTSVLRRG